MKNEREGEDADIYVLVIGSQQLCEAYLVGSSERRFGAWSSFYP
jgi:hypothetical protein